jgi:tyrosine-protein kinase Etk/Wzc
VQLTGTSPEETAATLNAIVTEFVDVAGTLKRAKLDELTEILAEQVTYAENNLREAEMSLEGFRIQTITLPSESSGPVAPGLEATRDPLWAQFFDLRITGDQIQRERAAIDRVLAGPELSVEGLETIGSVRGSSALTTALRQLNEKRAELRSLQFRYTDDHPMVQLVAEEVRTLEQGTIPSLARSLQTELDAQVSEINRQVETAGSDLRQIPPRMIEEARLRRQVAIASELYTNLERRYSEARLAAASSISDVRLLDAPTVPQRPQPGSQSWRIILMAVGGSLGAGLGLVLLLDRIDSKVRYPGQITTELGLPILATIPKLPNRRGADPESTDRLTEAFRTLRFNLQQAYGNAGPLVVTVSSPGRGEGKSFTSAHLAMSLAAMGRRTLLIDGDVRRGSLHRFFDLPRGTGLLECLRYGMRLDLARQKTRHENLHLLSGGRRLARGPELLGTAAMHELLATARSQYDAIIIDTPPFGAGADAFVFGTITGNLLVVLRTATSERVAMEMHMENLYRLPIRLLGAVMNDVPDSGPYKYYAYSYLPGYEARDEIEEIEAGEPMQLAGHKSEKTGGA